MVVTSGLEDASGTEEEIMVSSVLVKSLGVVSWSGHGGGLSTCLSTEIS